VAATGAYLFSQLQQPVYRSIVRLLVTPTRPDAGQTIAAQNLVQQYSLVATSEPVARAISRRLQLDLPPEAIQAKVRAAGLKDDLVVVVQVDDVSPTRARDIAAALAAEVEQQQALRMAAIDPRDRIEVRVGSPPQLGGRIWPSTRANVAAASVLGLLAGSALAWLLAVLNDTITTRLEVERYLQVAVLGVIPRTTLRSIGR
jgi:capsular polysaccharide biosynthesis protein